MSFFSDLLSNPIVDAGLSFIPGVGPAVAMGANALGRTLGGGQQGQPQGGGAIPLSAFDTSGGTMGANANAPAEQNQGHSGIMGSLEGLAGKAGDFLTGNGGKNALGVAQGLNAFLEQKKSTDLAKQALGSIEGSYNQRAPLRAQGLSMLANSQVGNPYAQQGR